MFSIANLAAGDLPAAYPRLETWRVRREITAGGTIRTFESALTARLQLDRAPAGAPLLRQQGWRWCSKCMGMTLQGTNAGSCPAGGVHDLTHSGEYTVLRNGQTNWRWCRKCQCLTFAGGAAGPCPAGGTHDVSGRSNGYWLTFAPAIDVELRSPRGGVPHRVHMELPYSSVEVPGQRDWHWCSRCQALSRTGGVCAGGVPHDHTGSGNYVVPMNAPTVPGSG